MNNFAGDTSSTLNEYEKIKAQGGPFDPLIQNAADTYGVSYALLHKQIFKESSFNPKAVSPTGPRGLAQMTRATGMAYGLVHDEDFFDPAKSIDAAARHMRDSIHIAGGDELKALLLYNQGGGRVGRSQLQAYDKGDFSGVSPEGLKYMSDLMDVTNTGKKAELDTFVKPASGFEAPAGIEAQPTAVPGGGPEGSASLGFEGEDIAPVAPSFAQELYEKNGLREEPDEDALFWGTKVVAGEALETSVLGMMVRAATANPEADFSKTYSMIEDLFNDPFAGGYYTTGRLKGTRRYRDPLTDWTDEEFDKLRSSGLDPQYYDVVLRGKRENFDDNLNLALGNQKLAQDAEGAGLGARIVGGAAGALGDPTSYMGFGIGTGATFAARAAKGAIVGGAIGGLSEHSTAKVSGREAHIGTAIAGGAAFGGVLHGLLGARPKADLPEPDLMEPSDILSMLRKNHDPEAADIASTTGRLQNREKARLDGLEEDPARMPFREGEEVKESNAGPYIDVPFDPDAARTVDGSIHSGGSPINPKTIEKAKELDVEDRAAMGFKFGGLTEIGLKLGRSQDPEMRGIAYDLFRSSTGYRDGSNGKFGATASDISERLRAQDNVAHNALAEQLDAALKDPFWHAQQMSQAAKQEAISRRIVEALESQKPAKLTPAEKELLESVREHMDQKWDYISNPAQFGDLRAKPLLEDTRHFSTYFPQRYSTSAKLMSLQRFGSPEGLQEAIAHSWMASYMSRPHVKARIDKMIQEGIDKANKGKPDAAPMTPEELHAAVQKYAKDKAYGISHTEQFNRSSIVEEHLKDGAGLENNDYLEARNLFDSDMRIMAPDGQDFSVNDLREFNIMRIVPQYDRRVNGDVAIMGGTGKTTKQLKDLATAMHQKLGPAANTSEADALMDAIKMFTGRARSDADGFWGTLARSLNDVGFMTKNAYMGVQNITEAASIIVKGHQKMLLKGVPMLKKWTTAGTKLAPEDIKQMHGLLFGRELDDLIRPTRQDLVDGLRQNSSEIGAQVAGSIKAATGWASAKSPFTWAIRETGNYIMDAGRQGVLVDLIDHTLNGKATSLFSPERLRSASISPEQFKGIQDLIRSSFKQNKKTGKWRIVDAQKLASDVRSMDLYRLGDRVADETMLRPHKMSLAPSKQYGAGLGMALQFKMFVLRSLNGRGMRGVMEATKNRQALDQVYQTLVSVGLATGFYAASAQIKALGMPERARKKYLDQASSNSMLAYAGISRSSHIGGPLSTAGFITAPFGFDPAAMVRTSILPREKQDGQGGRAIKYSPLQSDLMGGFMGRVAEQVPAAGVLANGVQAGYSGWHLATDIRGSNAQAHRTGLWNALRQFVPNDPVSQNLMMRLAEDQGVDRVR